MVPPGVTSVSSDAVPVPGTKTSGTPRGAALGVGGALSLGPSMGMVEAEPSHATGSGAQPTKRAVDRTGVA